MKKLTLILSVLIASYGVMNGQTPQQRNAGLLIHDNGSTFNVIGPPPLSILQDASLGMSDYGTGVSNASGFSVAEDFILIDNAEISSIDVYAYQTGATAPSVNEIYIQIWKGSPRSQSSTVVWGDLSTNLFEDAVSSGGYRQLESEPGDTSREIQMVTANTTGLSLTAGSYWIEYSLQGTASSGPWVTPIVITGQSVTGNALKNGSSGWKPLVDRGRQGLPFQIYGEYTGGSFPAPYCGPLAFNNGVDPITNVVFAGIRNSSSDETSSPSHEDFTTVIGSVELGSTYDIALEGNTNGNFTHSFTVFIDWNQNGSMDDAGERYEIGLIENSTGNDGNQIIAAIEVPENALEGIARMRVIKSSNTSYAIDSCDSGSNNGQAEDYSLLVSGEIETFFPEPYCGPVPVYVGVEPITNVLFAGIENRSSEELSSPEHEDFTAIEANVEQGGSYSIALEGNTDGAWAVTFTVFIDWNQNGTMDDEGERYEIGSLYNSTGIDGLQATGTIQVPEGALLGSTRMRISKVFGATFPPSSCSGFAHGQAEDYTIVVAEGGTMSIVNTSLQGFTYYPNPTNGILNLGAEKNMETISVYNLLGQRVFTSKIGASSSEIDLSTLANGTYIMKVTVDGVTGAYKIIKK